MTSSSYHETTQGELIERIARERPDAEAVVFPARGLRWTWSDLERRSLDLARGFVAFGIEPGERVVVWSDNRPDWIALQFALGRIGAVLVTANTALTRHEIGYLVQQSRASAIVSSAGVAAEEYLDALEGLLSLEDRGDLRHVITLEAEPRAGMLALEEVVRRGGEVPVEEVARRTAATQPDDPTNIQYTSGTTGFPKGVVLTHRNIVENGWAVSQGLGLDSTDRLLVQVPLFHCFGCVVCVLGATTHAATMVVLQRFDPNAALEAVATERCTVIHGVPTMFQAMLATGRQADLDLASLRTGVMAGSMCPEALMHRVVGELGCTNMLVAYGLTEASPAVTMPGPEDSVAVRCGTVGRALRGVDLRIMGPDNEVLATGEEGELQVRGPNVMQGYFENEAATAEAITADGWLCTGDLATIADDGLVRIVGRIKEMIIRGGENVYPAEVEDALRQVPGVADAAVFGVPSEHWGEEVAAAIVRAPEAELDVETLGAALEGRLAHYKRPAHVHFVESFPLTGSGKVRKFQLAEELGSQG